MHKATRNGKHPISYRNHALCEDKMLGWHLRKDSMKDCLCEQGQQRQQQPLHSGLVRKKRHRESTTHVRKANTCWLELQDKGHAGIEPVGHHCPFSTFVTEPNCTKKPTLWGRWPSPLLRSIRPCQLWPFHSLCQHFISKCDMPQIWPVRSWELCWRFLEKFPYA